MKWMKATCWGYKVTTEFWLTVQWVRQVGLKWGGWCLTQASRTALKKNGEEPIYRKSQKAFSNAFSVLHPFPFHFTGLEMSHSENLKCNIYIFIFGIIIYKTECLFFFSLSRGVVVADSQSGSRGGGKVSLSDKMKEDKKPSTKQPKSKNKKRRLSAFSKEKQTKNIKRKGQTWKICMRKKWWRKPASGVWVQPLMIKSLVAIECVVVVVYVWSSYLVRQELHTCEQVFFRSCLS